MQKKVLVVDDSALMRRVLSDIINYDDRFLVSRMAPNGSEALNLLEYNHEEFDAIILDINMPIMNGLEFLTMLEQKKIKATVIIVSTVAKEGTKETIRALELGAFDFVTKPNSFLDVKGDHFKNKIIECLVLATKLEQSPLKPIIKDELSNNKDTVSLKKETIIEPSMITRFTNRGKNSNKLVALACSTGGPKALQQVIPLLPDNLDCSILIVQHMPEGFTLSLSRRLDELSKLQVKEAEHGETLKNGIVYIAKGGSQMKLLHQGNGNHQISVTLEAARNGLKPCADILYESLVYSDFDEITCVVLTGMGSDGTNGIKKLSESKKVYVIAQDEATSTVYGMPKVITETGLVNEIVPLNQIANAIIKNVGVR